LGHLLGLSVCDNATAAKRRVSASDAIDWPYTLFTPRGDSMNAHTLLAQEANHGSGGAIALLIYLVILVIVLVGCWKMFVKAGQPGWGILIPIYNTYLMIKVAGRPGWWLILMFIPLVNIIVGIIITVDVARNFGKGVGFVLGMIFLGFIFYPILGFGSAQYQPVAH
jgi:hypothetical protein